VHYFWTALLGAIALLWLIQGVRLVRGLAQLPRLSAVAPLPDADCPSVSVLVPARDEAEKLSQALPTLLAQDYPRFEVIVVNDRSRDATGEILDQFARQHKNLKVIHLSELPPGWLGKPHGLYTAYQQARGDWLVFTDADVRFAPDLLRRALGLAQQQDGDHLTCFPLFELVGFGEKTAITWWALGFHLGQETWRASAPGSRRYMGIGAFQLLRRSTYEAIGTHRRLAMEVVDDMKLAKLVKQGGFRSGAALAEDHLRLRVEVGLGNIVRGLTKNCFAACGFSVLVLAGYVLATALVSLLPLAGLFFGSGLSRLLAGVAVATPMVLEAYIARQLRVSLLYGLTQPLGAAIFIYILLRSAAVTLWRGGVVWRDTFYSLKELRKGLV